MFAGAKARVSGWFKDQRFSLAKRQLESEIRQIVDLVEGHKDLGLTSGHDYYVRLRVKAQEAIERFQEQVENLGMEAPDYADIAMGIPALKQIDELASSASLTTNKGTAIVAAAMAVPFLITVVWSLCQGLHSFLLHLLVR